MKWDEGWLPFCIECRRLNEHDAQYYVTAFFPDLASLLFRLASALLQTSLSSTAAKVQTQVFCPTS